MQVQAELLVPLQAGFVDDVDASLKAFMAKANDAGLQTIWTNYKAQYKAYCDDMGIK